MSLPPVKILAVEQQHGHEDQDTLAGDSRDRISSQSINGGSTTDFGTTTTRTDNVNSPLPSSSIANPEKEGQTVAVGLGELSEDVLCQIFDTDNGMFSVKDLLNFRLVNRRWREVATSVLLKRNLCEISLSLGQVKLDTNGLPVPNAELQDVEKSDETKPRSNRNMPQYKYFHTHRRNFHLSDLNEIISISQKFPFSSIRFEAGCQIGFGKLCPSCDCEPHQENLMKFFELYGDKIRKLSLCNYVTKGAFQNLLYTYLPNVTSLDLSNFKKFTANDCSNPNQDIFYFSPFHASFKASKTLEIQEICLSADGSFEKDKRRLLKQIIKFSPKLRVLTNANLRQLKYLRKIGRDRLIQSVCYDPSVNEMPLVKEIVDFLPNNFNAGLINVRELAVMFTRLARNSHNYWQAAKAVNGILEACKESVKLLEFHVYAERTFADYINIPLLSKLKYLRLVEDSGIYATDVGSALRTRGDPIPRLGMFPLDFVVDFYGAGQHQIAYKEQKFPGQKMSGILQFGVDSMPNLKKVEVVLQDDNKGESHSYDKVLAHLTLQNFGEELLAYNSEAAFLTVTILELSRFCEQEGYLSKLFPNVRDLKIRCESMIMIQNWVWGAFEKLEKFEIEGLCGLCGTMDSNTANIDYFFTGLHLKSETDHDNEVQQVICQNLDSFSISQCKNLKEFKITFGTKLTSVFASAGLTAANGFQRIVPQTRIIFSFQAVALSSEEMKEMTETYLAPILPYIEIWK